MNSTFSGHFGYRRLLRVTLPSIVMMIFTSIYCVPMMSLQREKTM